MASSETNGGGGAPYLSVVVPVFNEAENAASLVAEIDRALDGSGTFEIIFVDDGSADGTAAGLRRLSAEFARLRLVVHKTRCGQSAAIRSGVAAARAPLVATLDGDGQNDPADIPKLIAARLAAAGGPGPLMITGRRTRRRDSLVKRVASRIANSARRRLLGDGTPDTGCGLKLFAAADYLELPRFDHMHRFLPALFLRDGGRVISVDVNHRPRRAGKSKYGVFDRLWVGIVDLLGVMWLKRRGARPEIDGAGDKDRNR